MPDVAAIRLMVNRIAQSLQHGPQEPCVDCRPLLALLFEVLQHRVGAYVDGPLGAREKMRNLTGGSIAIMCPACRRGAMTAGPDGVRDPVPNTDAASQAFPPSGFPGSSVRPIVISFSSFTPASTRSSRRHRLLIHGAQGVRYLSVLLLAASGPSLPPVLRGPTVARYA